jgi:hypothetical protein
MPSSSALPLWHDLNSLTSHQIKDVTTQHSRTNVRVAFHVKFSIHLRSTSIHHLSCIVLWVLSLILKLIPKWRATLALVLECYEFCCTLITESVCHVHMCQNNGNC